MKAKTILGMVACAGACVSLSAYGSMNDWFGVTVDTGITTVNCATNGAAVTVDSSNSKIVLDNDVDSPLTITPSVALSETNSTDIAKISVTALLTPSNTSDFETTDNAKAGFAVGIANNETNFYGYTSAGWVKLTGTVPEGTDTSFSIVLNYRDHKVQFLKGVDVLAAAVGGATEFDIDSGATGLTGLDAFGSGSITSIDSDYEVAEVAYNNKKYGSVAEAVAAGGSAANITEVTPSGAAGSSTSSSGLPVAVCKALGIDTTAENPDPVAVLPVANDGDANNITLAMDHAVEPGVTVKFAVKKNGAQVGELFPASAIKIPLESGTGVYTVEPADVVTAQ